MKVSKILVLSALAMTVAGTSCKKKGCMDADATNYTSEAKKDDGSCVYAPTITLNGQSTITLSVGDTYTELGATAQNADGSTAEVTIDNSAVDANAAGTYSVSYTATNENGTAVVTRTVIVEINQSTYIADWTCASDCGTTQFPIDGTRTIIAGASSNQFIIDGFFTAAGGQLTGTISGTSITVPSQTINVSFAGFGGDVIVSGSGSMNSAGTEFTINFDYDNQIQFIGGTGSCTGIYTKQ